MKSKRNKDNKRLLSNESIIQKEVSISDNESLDVHESDITIRLNKRKTSSPSQDGYCDFEHSQPQQKRKLMKEKRIETVNFQSVTEMSEESDSESSKQDNTPVSLKKPKKTKKKKNKITSVIAHPNTSTLDYLRNWKSDRGHWKFEKIKQKRLVSNMFESEKLPDDYFAIFLEYMEGGSKSMKELMSKLANEVVAEMEKWESLSEAEKETTTKLNETKYKRARTVLQILQ